jgi:4-hydroxy-3-methylbut-2-en-1-yl diphosphate reductase
MAVTAVERALELYGAPLYAFHQIVHNRTVVSDFERRGVRFVDDLANVPRGAVVVFSAHGVCPAVRAVAAERNLLVVDATCPLVSKVHTEARRFVNEAYTVIFVGHAGHDETVGVMGEAPRHILLVETCADVDRLIVPDPQRVAYLTQTTLGVDDTRLILQALQRRFPGIVGPPHEDVCYATQNRQAAIGRLAGGASLALVLGSRNSSNSLRLVEVAAARGAAARLIDGPEDLRPEWFDDGVLTVAVTAGASVPESQVKATVDVLVGRYGARVDEFRTAEESTQFSLPVPVRATRCRHETNPGDA